MNFELNPIMNVDLLTKRSIEIEKQITKLDGDDKSANVKRFEIH